MKHLTALAALCSLAGCVAAIPVVAPPPMVLAPEQRNLAAEIAARPDLSIFAAQLAASGDARLAAAPPMTVFATQDDAYARLAPGVVPAMLTEENRPLLTKVVAYHIVPGALDPVELRRRVAAGNGRATLVTLAGDPLVVTLTGTTLTLTDVDGDVGYVGEDVRRPNGILYPVNGFLAPAVE